MTIREMMLTTEDTQVFCVHTVKDFPRSTARITGTLEEIESDKAHAPLLDMEIDSWGVVDDMIDVTVILDDPKPHNMKPSEIVWFVGHQMKRIPDKDVIKYIDKVAPADGYMDIDTFLLRGFYAGMKMALESTETMMKKALA